MDGERKPLGTLIAEALDLKPRKERDDKGKFCDAVGCDERTSGKHYKQYKLGPFYVASEDLYYCRYHRWARKKRDKLIEAGVLPWMLEEAYDF